MKKFLVYITVLAAIVAVGCTDFGDVDQLKLDTAAPDADITDIVPAADSVSFTVAPLKAAGYYAWLVVESDKVEDIAADNILKQLATGVAQGVTNYTEFPDTTVIANELIPFTVYHIYAVAATVDGVLGKVTVKSFRTLDDGDKPTPQEAVISDTIISLTFHEPIKMGTGKVYASYFAKNTLTGVKPFSIIGGYEEFNPQDVLIPLENLSVKDKDLIIELPDAPAGAYVSITYEAGAVVDLEGNNCSPYLEKADSLGKGVPIGDFTVQIPHLTWELAGEFDEINPDTVVAFSDWKNFYEQIIPVENTLPLLKVSSIIPTVVFHEASRTIESKITTWGVLPSGIPAFFLPEEPAFGAVLDFKIPAGAFEDVYGNSSEKIEVKGNYIYSYGYKMEDVIGVYDVDFTPHQQFGAAYTESDIVIKAGEKDTLLIQNLVVPGTEIYGIFDPVMGTIAVPNDQVFGTFDFGASGEQDIVIDNLEGLDYTLFSVPKAGTIVSEDFWWGFFVPGLNGWYDLFTDTSWTRTGSVSAPAPAPQKVKSLQDYLKLSSKSIISKGRVIKR